MSEYPEHDKLTKVSDVSQAQGELLDWLMGQGVHLMRWEEFTETAACVACSHISDAARERCAARQNCPGCKGTHQVLRHREGWIHEKRSIQDILAEHHGIDQQKLEREKRGMLASLREHAS